MLPASKVPRSVYSSWGGGLSSSFFIRCLFRHSWFSLLHYTWLFSQLILRPALLITLFRDVPYLPARRRTQPYSHSSSFLFTDNNPCKHCNSEGPLLASAFTILFCCFCFTSLPFSGLCPSRQKEPTHVYFIHYKSSWILACMDPTTSQAPICPPTTFIPPN